MPCFAQASTYSSISVLCNMRSGTLERQVPSGMLDPLMYLYDDGMIKPVLSYENVFEFKLKQHIFCSTYQSSVDFCKISVLSYSFCRWLHTYIFAANLDEDLVIVLCLQQHINTYKEPAFWAWLVLVATWLLLFIYTSKLWKVSHLILFWYWS